MSVVPTHSGPWRTESKRTRLPFESKKKFLLAKQLGALLLLSVSRIESECRIAFRIVEVCMCVCVII